MPEGHTIHRIAREHRAYFVGDAVVVSSPQGRFVDAERLTGRSLRAVDAYGKHLFYEFDGRRYVHVHLGLFGKVWTAPQPATAARPTVRMRLEVDDWYADLIGPTRCRLVDADQKLSLIHRLGPDPLRADADPERALARVARSSQPIAALLMDQSVVAGIGNVYRAELLFRAGIDPFVPGTEIGADTWMSLWQDAKKLMRAGVRQGRIITTEPTDRQHHGRHVRATDAHYVYRRTGQWCRRCRAEVRATDLAGRTLYWCPTCQR
jgi:DNA-formamidopyrimidine glycosylase